MGSEVTHLRLAAGPAAWSSIWPGPEGTRGAPGPQQGEGPCVGPSLLGGGAPWGGPAGGLSPTPALHPALRLCCSCTPPQEGLQAAACWAAPAEFLRLAATQG